MWLYSTDVVIFKKMEVKSFRPAVSEGLNPTVHILKSGSRPRGHYLFTLGLNPSGYYYTFWVCTQSLLFIKSGSEPNSLEIVFWVQTQRSIFINSGSEPRCSKIRFWVYTQRSLFGNCWSETSKHCVLGLHLTLFLYG